MNWFEQARRNTERAKRMFPVGKRIELTHMNDPYNPIPDGTRGTVERIDDIGTIFVKWDNGRTLGVIYGEDSFRALNQKELSEEKRMSEESEIAERENIPSDEPNL